MGAYDVFSNAWELDKGVTFGKKKISYRELILSTIVIIFSCIAIGLCMYLIAHHVLHTEMQLNITEECTTPGCYGAASSISLFRDTTVTPCHDFYSYACGNWAKYEKQSDMGPTELDRTVHHLIRERNEVKLTRQLEADVKDDDQPFMKKVKYVFHQCINEYERTRNGSKLFLDRVLRPAGGWNALPGWNIDNFDYTRSLKKLHIDFWKTSFIRVKVASDWVNAKQNVIELDLGHLTLYWWEYYYTSDYYQKMQDAAKQFMVTISELVLRDSGLYPDAGVRQTKANAFADDVFQFEMLVANITAHTLPSDDPHANERRVTLSELNSIADTFDWVDIITSMFSESGISQSSKIILLERDYIGKVNDMIKLLPEPRRTLNNYFTWRLMQGYVADLGWEYIHANRVFYVERTGLSEFLGVPKYCFNKVQHHFADALGSMFIRDHLVTDDKAAVDEVFQYLKQGLADRLDEVEWMEPETRAYAIEKNRDLVDKIGYPAWMANNDEMDTRYQSLEVTSSTDYLANLIAVAAFEKKKLNDLLVAGEDKSVWRLPIYDTYGSYDQYWNEIIIPAGVLQWPMFNRHLPKYYNFGAFGTYMGYHMVHAVDEIGGYYLKNGSYYDWWTKNTTLMYNEKRRCLEDLDIQAGPYKDDATATPRYVKIDGTYVARAVAAEVAGLRVGFQAYRDYVKARGTEQIAPGLKLTNEQTFFLAYAQTQCFVRRDFYSLMRADRHILPEDNKVNLALAHTPGFVEAFNCPKNTRMHAEKMCEVF